MKDIKGYEGEYAITSCGRVWSYKSKKFLKPTIRKNGYAQVCLSKNSIQKNLLVHRLVAEAYLSNANNFTEVNHKDEIKSHNWVGNLEWCTHQENINYGTRTSRAVRKQMKKVICVETGEIFDGVNDAARKTGLSAGHISQVCNKKRNTTGGLHWKFYF